MTDNIKRVTPREIIDMVMEAEVHGDTQFVLATAHDFEIQCFRARVAAHDAEILRLRARVAELEYAHSKALAAIANIQQDAQEVGPP